MSIEFIDGKEKVFHAEFLLAKGPHTHIAMASVFKAEEEKNEKVCKLRNVINIKSMIRIDSGAMLKMSN